MIARFTTLTDGRPVPVGINPTAVALVVPHGAAEAGPTTLHLQDGHPGGQPGGAVVVEEGFAEAMRRLNGEAPEATAAGPGRAGAPVPGPGLGR